ncbi:MAG: HAD-IA family hydrolase, partial [Desulfobacteraceae bacterium]|nr:HAD-IA family hydrolase [Desulfobacteraceae bacterium]
YRENERETFIETTLDELVLKALLDSGHYDAELAEIVKASVDHGLHTRRLTWYQDAEGTLLRLKDLGYKIGLISNTHWRWLPERRREVQLFFDVITLSYEHGYLKPHPSIFHTTLMKLNVKPEKGLHVGDNPFADVWGAKKAGMKAAYIRRNELYAEADVIIQQLSELIPCLDR